jgi:hypothetical protein
MADQLNPFDDSRVPCQYVSPDGTMQMGTFIIGGPEGAFSLKKPWSWDNFLATLPAGATVVARVPSWAPWADRDAILAWLTWLANLPPEPFMLAQHCCAVAFDEFGAMASRIIYDIDAEWQLQKIVDAKFGQTNEEIFGDRFEGISIEYCPWCGVHLPDLGNETCVLTESVHDEEYS